MIVKACRYGTSVAFNIDLKPMIKTARSVPIKTSQDQIVDEYISHHLSKAVHFGPQIKWDKYKMTY